jgi:predicted GIY-YIG superfamily endonuclease
VTALYRHYDAAGTLLYIGIATNPMERTDSHLRVAAWADQIASVTVERHPSRDAALRAERLAVVAERPLHNSIWHIADEEKAAVANIIAALTPEAMCAALGSGKHAVRFAKNDGKFPGSWYGTLLPLCDAAGIECPLDAFRWKTPAEEQAA